MVDIFEFVRKDESRGPWHIGWESGYFNEPSHTLCGAELYGYTDSAPDLPEGGRLCARCRKELERRTRMWFVIYDPNGLEGRVKAALHKRLPNTL